MNKPAVTPLLAFGKSKFRIRSPYIREAIGEFFGTLIVGFMCVGAGGQFLITTKDGIESQIVPVLGIILGIMTAILITGGVSGGHVNPAVSISLAVIGDLSWYSVPGYVLSQFLGAIVGALLGWGLIHPSIRHSFEVANKMTIPQFDMDHNNTHRLQIASIFSRVKSPGCTVFNGLATELVLTCFLMMAICGVADKQSHMKPPAYLVPLVIPLAIAAFCFTHELPTGTLLNPARDLGPRIAACILGWDAKAIFMSKDWDENDQHWWIVGLFGPILGGILGALLYSFIIGPQVSLEHLQVPDRVSLPQQQRESIRQMMATVSTDDGCDWRSSNTINTCVINRPLVGNKSCSFPSFTTNTSITDAYQQRSPFIASRFSNTSYPNINGNIRNGDNLNLF